ncbi:MAG TPA: putative Ig domain-containing protein [Steroidobacteraceae bacterium]|nr:putative Ig domain-containing protein [Steroidobacteraceae bacterium]
MPYRRSSRPGRKRLATLVFCHTLVFLALGLPAHAATSNQAPKIRGTPSTTAVQRTTYVFQPVASDPDGDRLTFSIVNKPRWMWFSTRTGKLTGVPKWAQRNRTFSNIVIRVSDGRATAALPAFSIRVGTGSGSGTGNRAPTISGTPAPTAQVGRPYAFRPTARDADGDKLTFSIVNKPVWATFDASNGTVWGTPTKANVGKYSNVTIKVSDGKATASLTPFAITVTTSATRSVTLSWTSPTRNTDGTRLTDLAGYRVYYGQESRDYSGTVNVPAAATQSVVIENLAAGTWYFAIRSFNREGVLSGFSGEVKAEL